MKNTITLTTVIALFLCNTVCDFEGYITEESGVMSFLLDSSGVNKGYYTLGYLRTGTYKDNTMIDAIRIIIHPISS